MMNPFDRVLH